MAADDPLDADGGRDGATNGATNGTVDAVTARIKALALAAGFSRVGVARAHARPDDEGRLRAWLDAGMHGPMAWLERDPSRRSDPGRVVADARSVIVLALDYDSDAPRTATAMAEAGVGSGWISRYAWGDDYHDVAERRLRSFSAAVQSALVDVLDDDFRGADQPAGPFDARRDFRWEVDYGPMLERPWAQEAGLGWQGKHSLLVDPARGSYFFLATIVTTLALAPDTPSVDQCGSCTRCIDACPTDAIVADRVVDARRCISTLTIETKGALTPAQSQLLGDHVFGCDICQDVCPFNRFSRPSGEVAFAPRAGSVAPRLADLAGLDAVGFAERFRRSPIKRAKFSGLLRNVEAVVANQAAAAAKD